MKWLEKGNRSPDDGMKEVPELSEIARRYSIAKDAFEPFHRRAKRNQNRYRFGINAGGVGSSGIDVDLDTLAIGEPNPVAVNIRLKVANVGIANPDFYVTTDTPEFSEIIRMYTREHWRKKHWTRVTQRALLSRYITGLGLISTTWDRMQGFIPEYIPIEDFWPDPDTTYEEWSNLNWCFRRVWVRRDAAKARYGDKIDATEGTRNLGSVQQSRIKSARISDSIPIIIYTDANYEIELDEDVGKILGIRPNPWGRVPIRAIIGDPDPLTEWPMGDYDTISGVAEMHRNLSNQINWTAQNPGIPCVYAETLDEKSKDAIASGDIPDRIILQGIPMEGQAPPFTWSQPAPLDTSVLTALGLVSNAIDADQGSGQYDRGVIENRAGSATEAAIQANRSTSRSLQNKSALETLLEEISRDLIDATHEFGLDPIQGPVTDEAYILWQAAGEVKEIRVIEESLAYKAPELREQSAIMRLQQAATLAPTLMQIGARIPNLERYLNDVLIAGGKQDTEQYWLQSPMMQMPPQVTGEYTSGEPDTDGGGSPPAGGGSPPAGDAGDGGRIHPDAAGQFPTFV
jgi:hypothetical protein